MTHRNENRYRYLIHELANHRNHSNFLIEPTNKEDLFSRRLSTKLNSLIKSYEKKGDEEDNSDEEDSDNELARMKSVEAIPPAPSVDSFTDLTKDTQQNLKVYKGKAWQQNKSNAGSSLRSSYKRNSSADVSEKMLIVENEKRRKSDLEKVEKIWWY